MALGKFVRPTGAGLDDCLPLQGRDASQQGGDSACGGLLAVKIIHVGAGVPREETG